ncbi:glycosyl hydrolase 53 family protein [Hymenobacter sp. IS2118]|uniref:glycosyl hydrolase 53 family protein n=1 Tax=Hymenobacter sp. IS2118 TaxID=1505605 RepID=UPI0009075A04|nr:glycosyl hydrolase 53 family protein [Hymenobacter sp. IS2118]
MKHLLLFALLLGLLLGLAKRAQAQTPAPFAKGADVSWVTQMEQANYRFYNPAGTEQDLFQLLRDYDLNTIRLRVWVNPAGGWNGKNDVIAKAIRARNLGFRVMIDFHYSDEFADPGRQNKPVAWQNFTFPQLKTAVYDHTVDVLSSLKSNNVVPEWVQVGNETPDGLLWPDGRISTNAHNFAELVDQGYAAVKAVNPTTKVIVHVDNGFDNARSRYMVDALTQNGGRFDVIGLSLYPTVTNWPTLTAQCLANMNDLVARYPGKEVMVVETGMPANAPIPTQQMLLDLMAKVRAVPGNKGLGVLYWEPQAYNWMSYGLSMWNTTGRPTVAIDAFLDTPPTTGLVANPSFEDTGATQTPLGWATTSPTGDADADFTDFYGYTTPYQLVHQQATAYQVRTFQLLANVPNGTYTLRAWAQSTGTQSQLYATGFGGAELAATLPVAANWVRVQVPGIVVANGQCEIGLRSVAAAGERASIDDVEFTATAVTAGRPAAPGFTADVFPNPSAGPRTLTLSLAHEAPVELALFSLTGQRVRTLAAPPRLGRGTHTLPCAAPGLAPGTYLLKISHGPHVAVRKFVQL